MNEKRIAKLICPVRKVRTGVVKKLETNTYKTDCEVLLEQWGDINNLNERSNIWDQVKQVIQMRTIRIPKDIKWISDYMINESRYWKYGQYIFVNCPTGTGKTTFMERMLRNINGQVLILTNRKANKRQIEEHLKSYGYSSSAVRITSYQEIEKNDIYTSEYLDCFSCIFMDESHYFLQDSNFNSMTNISLNLIMKTQRCLKVFMSATNENICQTVVAKLIKKFNYNLPMVMSKILIYHMQYKPNVIKRVISLNSMDGLCENIENSNGKWLVFVTSINKGKELLYSLKKKEIDAVFLDRDSADRGTKEQKSTFNTLIAEERFMQKVLIVTCLLDNGVNIKDLDLCNLVIFDYDRVEIIQMMGRKRSLSLDDKYDLYLVDEDIDEINSILKGKYRLKNKFLKVKEDIEVLESLDKVHYMNCDDGDLYRTLSYYDPRTKKYNFNYLGLRQNWYEISMLYELLNSDESSLKQKLKWIVPEDEIKLLEVVQIKDIREKEILSKIDKYLHKMILKADKDMIINFRNDFTQSFWEVYGKCKGDRNDRPFTIKRINQVINEIALPLELKTEKDYIIMTKKERG